MEPATIVNQEQEQESQFNTFESLPSMSTETTSTISESLPSTPRLDDNQYQIFGFDQRRSLALAQHPEVHIFPGANIPRLKRYISSLYVNLEFCRGELVLKDQLLEQQRSKASIAFLENQDLKERLLVLEERIRNMNSSQFNEDDKKQLSTRHQNVRSDTNDFQQQRLEEDNQVLRAQLRSVTQIFNKEVDRLNTELSECTVLLNARERKFQRLQKEMNHCKDTLHSLTQQHHEISATLKERVLENAKLKEDVKKYRVNCEGAQRDRAIVLEQKIHLEKELSECRARIQALNEQVTQRHDDNAAQVQEFSRYERERHASDIALQREEHLRELDRQKQLHEAEVSKWRDMLKEERSLHEGNLQELTELRERQKFFDNVSDLQELESKALDALQERDQLQSRIESLEEKLLRFEANALTNNKANFRLRSELSDHEKYTEKLQNQLNDLRFRFAQAEARSSEQNKTIIALKYHTRRVQEQLDSTVELNSRLVRKIGKYKARLR